MTAPQNAAEVKACCAAAYDQDAVALILGDSYHPGGLALTRRLATATGLQPGQRVLDVASGAGATAVLLAAEFGVTVDGVDLAQNTLRKAAAAAQATGLAGDVRFHLGDAERLPFPDACFDAVICECAFCTFPDKPGAAREFARVLKPRGRVGITDVTVTAGDLPAELDCLAGWIACLADAKPADDYARLLTDTGLRALLVENHDAALAQMVDQIDARLRALRMTRALALAGVDLGRALELTAHAARAVETGTAGYALIVAEKPG